MKLSFAAFLLLSLALLAPKGFGQSGVLNILFIAGEPSHGWNQHEFPAGCELLAKCLNDSGLGLKATVSLGWPEDESLLEQADALVLYSDGNDLHVARGRHQALDRLYEKGTGIAVLHYALESGDAPLDAFFQKAIGGYFEVDWSVNPVWTLTQPIIAAHPATRGVTPFELEDEWYYHLRFQPKHQGLAPLLSAHPPASSLGQDGPRTGNPAVRAALERKEPQSLAWTRTGAKGQRGFGFTGGHFHFNWNNNAVRKLVLNGIAWTAGAAIPTEGIASKIRPIVMHESIERAIAMGDAEDVQRHIANDPGLLNRPGRGNYTPLHQAILRKKPQIVSSLLKQGADPNALTSSKQSALHLAIGSGDIDSSKAVLAVGVDLSLKDSNGWTALHLAAAKNKPELAKLLIDSGAVLSLLSDAGGTPLHEASVSGGEAILKLLLESGVDPSVVSKTGKTALDHALEFKNEAAIRILKSK